MNFRKWENDNIPLSVLALKLCEEAAEVGGEISDALIRADGYQTDPGGATLSIRNRKEAILVEIDHVRHLCDQIERRVNQSKPGKFLRV